MLQRALVCVSMTAVAVVGTGAGSASAGEISGNGTLETVKGASECAFSGQNDGFHIGDLAESPEDAATRVQSYGQVLRHIPPGFKPKGLPGMLCNPAKAIPPPPPPA